MKITKRYDYFSNREGRAHFIAKTFTTEIENSASVLDVGCDYNTLKKILGQKVTGIDLYGAPDITVDFEKEKLTQFQDRQFDFVVCTEVLEHLENFHEMVDELCRVSNKYILISLPNCTDIFTRMNILFRGKASKFYGLPLEKPEDRHRWFFSSNDAQAFFRAYAKRNNLSLSREFLNCNFSNSWKGILVRNFVKIFDINTAAQSYWILLEKK